MVRHVRGFFIPNQKFAPFRSRIKDLEVILVISTTRLKVYSLPNKMLACICIPQFLPW
jgi:hypothetical protein